MPETNAGKPGRVKNPDYRIVPLKTKALWVGFFIAYFGILFKNPIPIVIGGGLQLLACFTAIIEGILEYKKR